ncbi:hypothetical protein LTR48_000703 [Friedmanniomyces endolithicus]|nr:hypothetical protein LTR48_000703 [Friedmanniomyces endolithicus]
MEANTSRRAVGLRDKIPDIDKTLETVKFLSGRKANVMLSYPLTEAETLLRSKLDAAQSSLENCDEDLDFLREQITTMEVATARVYNWDVNERRKEKASGGGDGEDEAKGRPDG